MSRPTEASQADSSFCKLCVCGVECARWRHFLGLVRLQRDRLQDELQPEKTISMSFAGKRPARNWMLALQRALSR